MRKLERILLAVNDKKMRESIRKTLLPFHVRIHETNTVKEALFYLFYLPDLVIIDTKLKDGTGLKVAERALWFSPTTIVVALSKEICPEEAFFLGRIGVRVLLAKPLDLDELIRAITWTLKNPMPLEPPICSWIEHASLHQIMENVRRVVVEQALEITDGNISQAADLLGISRQAVQKFVHQK